MSALNADVFAMMPVGNRNLLEHVKQEPSGNGGFFLLEG